MPDIASMIMIGNAAIKLGTTAWNAYCELNEENVDAFSAERIEAILQDYQTTDEQLAAAGLNPDDFK